MKVQIAHVATKAEAERLAAEGWEPIECSFGTEGSALGRFALDHHGEESGREGVALRAWRDHHGALESDPRFVTTGDADEDATFAIACLAGLLPHPSRGGRDLGPLAELINAMDVDPILAGPTLENHPFGAVYLLWGHLSSGARDATAFHAGIDRWRALLAKSAPGAILAAASAQEAERVRLARTAMVGRVGDHVALVESELAWGFDVWYSETPGTPFVVAFDPASGSVTIGCRDARTAERFLGPGGLKALWGAMPKGWGGRESIGGGPRGVRLSRTDALEAAATLSELVSAASPAG